MRNSNSKPNSKYFSKLMNDINELHQEASKLRKEGEFTKALALYDKLWPETLDQYDGAGLLNCLRKLQQYDRAVPFATELIKKYPDFEWAKNEVIWTLVSGKLNNLSENCSLYDVIEVANEIMKLGPSELAQKLTVFKVLKAAKKAGNWECVSNWSNKINPDNLNTTPMTDAKGREGWCDQSLWYNYKAKCLIEMGKPEDVLLFIDKIIEKYRKQNKFFSRFKAQALYKLGKLNESAECYEFLCSNKSVDWWLLHEYSRVVRDKGDFDQALKLMYRAAKSNRKLELMVSLFQEIGLLCMQKGKNEVARTHITLSSLIRDQQEWSVLDINSNTILELNSKIGNTDAPKTIKQALEYCNEEWDSVLGLRTDKKIPQDRKPRRGLRGKVLLGKPERSFCFIHSEKNESFFCSKSDLPEGINDRETVGFSAISSFDKKKNKESWKAVNVFRNS